MTAIEGPAFVSGVIETIYETFKAMRSDSPAKVYHRYPVGSDQEFAFSKGCEYTTTRLLAGAEFAVQVRET